MLSCDDVRGRLAEFAAGERATPDVREHLARCDACRAERERLAADWEHIREGLASLAPSPFLEDAVVEAAAGPLPASGWRRRWAYVAAATAAAAALFLVAVLPRLAGPDREPQGRAAGDGGSGRASVAIPPSAGEVHAARQRNPATDAPPPDALPEGVRLHVAVLPSGESRLERAAGFLPAGEDARHRYVYGDPEARPGRRVVGLTTWPRSGVMLLGSGLLTAIGGKVRAGDVLTIARGDREWRTTPGAAEGEIVVASPDEGGAEARVRVLVSTGYEGTLLLEEPLARALGLHLFEIPGGVRFDAGEGIAEDGPRGHRARARVRIPELAFDRVVEVQVLAAAAERPPPPGPPSRITFGFEGEEPTAIVYGRALGIDAEGRAVIEEAGVVRRPEQGEGFVWPSPLAPGAWRLVFSYEGDEVHEGAVPAVPDVPLLGELFRRPPALLVPGVMDLPGLVHASLRTERVTLRGQFTPGADVTIARVWRGTTAVPSREAVVLTTVAEDGRISFPRLAGEAGATLRMLVSPKEGASAFHEVVMDPMLLATPRLELIVDAGGWVVLGDWRRRVLSPAESAEEEVRAVPGALDALAEELRRRADRPPMRDERGVSRLALAIRAEKEVPWRLVQWILQAAAQVRIQRFSFAALESGRPTVEHRLPLDEGLAVEEAAPPVVRVVLRRPGPGEPLHIRAAVEPGGATMEWGTGGLDLPLKDVILALKGTKKIVRGEIDAPPPGLVTFAEVARVLDAFLEAGFSDVRFEGAPPR